MLNIVWYNINGIKGKHLDVVDMMEQGDIDVLMLQEATAIDELWHKRLEKQFARIGCTLLCEVPNAYLATVVRITTVPTFGVVHSDDRLQVVRVVQGDNTVTLANHYGPHNRDENHYKRVGSTLAQLTVEGQLLVGGDHNAVTVESDRTGARLDNNSRLFTGVMDDCGLMDVNESLGVERFHTCYRSGSSSRIDSVWANRAALGKIEQVAPYVDNGVNSDHIPTTVTIKSTNNVTARGGRVSYKFPRNKMDPRWVKYAETVMDDLNRASVKTLSCVEKQCKLITDALVNRAEQFRSTSAERGWIHNRAVRRLLKQRKCLLRLLAYGEWSQVLRSFDTSSRPEILKRLREVNDRLHQRRYKRSNKKFRKWEWAARTAEFLDPSKFFSAATAKKSSRVRLARIRKDNVLHTDPEVVSEAAAAYFEQAFCHEEADMSFLSSLTSGTDRHKIAMEIRPFGVEEVEESMGWLRNRKCPGADGVWNEMVKLPATETRNYRNELAEVLCGLFNKIMASGVFPTAWKECIIIPAYKKGDTTCPQNYRPICLLSSLSKLFTKLLNQRIAKAAEAGGVFTNTQGGGRRMRDIREKLSIIRGVIDHANRHDNQLYLLLTDISKAFDSVPHNAIRAAYEFFGFPQGVVELVSNMVTDNQARVLSTTLSRRFPMGKGTRQGDNVRSRPSTGPPLCT